MLFYYSQLVRDDHLVVLGDVSRVQHRSGCLKGQVQICDIGLCPEGEELANLMPLNNRAFSLLSSRATKNSANSFMFPHLLYCGGIASDSMIQ